jgi:hypothetical protein
MSPMCQIQTSSLRISTPIPQGIDHCGEGQRRLPAAWVIQVVPSEFWAPAGKHADKPAFIQRTFPDTRDGPISDKVLTASAPVVNRLRR